MVNKKLLFHQLSEQEQREFISKLMDSIRTSNRAYYDAKKIVQESENKGDLENIKYFNENIHK